MQHDGMEGRRQQTEAGGQSLRRTQTCPVGWPGMPGSISIFDGSLYHDGNDGDEEKQAISHVPYAYYCIRSKLVQCRQKIAVDKTGQFCKTVKGTGDYNTTVRPAERYIWNHPSC